jgi:lysophospholipase L1-like esterase
MNKDGLRNQTHRRPRLAARRPFAVAGLFVVMASLMAAPCRSANPPGDTSASFTYADASVPGQIPLCMIGDSITWTNHGDEWRRGLLALYPGFAFIGTHSGKLGYSHAGEGGNGTRTVISRLPEIPDCPYYSLLIGTNDTNIRDAARKDETAAEVADRITTIVSALLQKQGVRRVFLCSLLPCHTSNPLRDQINAAVNAILRDKLAAGLFDGQPVTWVELEQPLRALPGWEKMIALHPSPEGYRHIARLHGEAILAALAVKDHSAPVPKAGAGVRVVNLWDAARQATSAPVIAGWYTVSFELKTVSGTAPAVRVLGAEGLPERLDQRLVLDPADAGKRVTLPLFTSYEGYGYTRSALTLATEQCVIDRILIEKRRPSGLASAYGEGVYIDTATTPSPGELLERAASAGLLGTSGLVAE